MSQDTYEAPLDAGRAELLAGDTSLDLFLDRQEDPETLRRLVEAERRFCHHLASALEVLERRLQAIESSRLWKMLAAYRRLKVRVKRANSSWLGKLLLAISRPGRKFARRTLAALFKQAYLLLEDRPVTIVPRPNGIVEPIVAAALQDEYALWRAHHMPRAIELRDYRARLRSLPFRPTISVLLAFGDAKGDAKLEAFERTWTSVREQVYPAWELCIAYDDSTCTRVQARIAELVEGDARVKAIRCDRLRGRTVALNSALALATGEFAMSLDVADRLSTDALYQYAMVMNDDRTAQILYADEDRVDGRGQHHAPQFKPQWCADNLLSHDYIGRGFVARTTLVRSVGGFREQFAGAEDYDLILRLTERTERIRHIPRVVTHRDASRKPDRDGRIAAIEALTQALERRGEPGEVAHQSASNASFHVRYALKRPGKVGILIPTRDKAEVLEVCLRSLFTLTEYRDFEVVVIDNDSAEAKTAELLGHYRRRQPERFRVLSMREPFNFSRLMNAAVAEIDGAYVLLLNNDTEITHGDWLGAMVEQAQRPAIGCVGAQLLYPDRTLQHAGVVLGRGEAPAGHAYYRARPDDPRLRDQVQTIRNYSAVTAACSMVRAEVFREVGGYDESLAIDYNDIDFCLRVREAGYRNIYLPHVVLYHHESLTRGHPLANSESAKRYEREANLIRRRWSRYIEDDPCFSPHVTLGGVDETAYRLDRPMIVDEEPRVRIASVA